ncbi:MAG: hypothetical protein AVDCRST_MAG76-2081, partial [uncultured Acidimicrobiales bacterium]
GHGGGCGSRPARRGRCDRVGDAGGRPHRLERQPGRGRAFGTGRGSWPRGRPERRAGYRERPDAPGRQAVGGGPARLGEAGVVRRHRHDQAGAEGPGRAGAPGHADRRHPAVRQLARHDAAGGRRHPLRDPGRGRADAGHRRARRGRPGGGRRSPPEGHLLPQPQPVRPGWQGHRRGHAAQALHGAGRAGARLPL